MKVDSTCSNIEISPGGYNANVIQRDRNCYGGRVFVLSKDELAMYEVPVKHRPATYGPRAESGP